MKKLLAISFGLVLVLSLFPLQSQAAKLIPCGGCEVDLDPATGECPAGGEQPTCGLCHILVLVKNLVNFLLVPTDTNNNLPLVPILGGLMLAVGGFFFFVAAGAQQGIQRGKQIFTAVVVSFLIIYGSWLFLGLLLDAMGVADWTGLGKWWEITCETPPSTACWDLGDACVIGPPGCCAPNICDVGGTDTCVPP